MTTSFYRSGRVATPPHDYDRSVPVATPIALLFLAAGLLFLPSAASS